MSASFRSWATPLATGTFAISAITGIFLFLDIEIGNVEPVHKWIGIAMVAGVMFHVVANWKQFTGYLSKKPAVAIMATALLATLLSVLPIGGEEGERENPAKMAASALAGSSLETVAPVLGTTPAKLMEGLQSKGLTVTDTQQRVTAIAKANGVHPKELLADLFVLSGLKPHAEEDGD